MIAQQPPGHTQPSGPTGPKDTDTTSGQYQKPNQPKHLQHVDLKTIYLPFLSANLSVFSFWSPRSPVAKQTDHKTIERMEKQIPDKCQPQTLAKAEKEHGWLKTNIGED